MIPVQGFPFSGDQPKANVSLQLAGLTDGQFYVLGDRLEGELTVTPQEDRQLRGIVFRLEYLMKGKWETAILRPKTITLPVPEVLKGGQQSKFVIRIPDYYFQRPSYKGEHLNCHWRLNVFLENAPAKNEKSFVSKELKVDSLEQRHGTSFEILVRYGKGAYRVAPKELPIGLIGLSAPSKGIFLLIFISAMWFSGAGIGPILQDGWPVMLILALVVLMIWLVVRLSTFQMTPMEVKPLRDGQLRLRILDRGNNQLEKAIVGYRILECYETLVGGNATQKKSNCFQKTFPFAEVSRREEHLYEAVLPWPDIDLPTTGLNGIGEFEWEVFLQLPNPLTGGMHEKSWPIEVTWEQFRLAPPTAEELEQNELETMELRELALLPKREDR
jgi:hypothetical protein